jgi:hypothetical protein
VSRRSSATKSRKRRQWGGESPRDAKGHILRHNGANAPPWLFPLCLVLTIGTPPYPPGEGES